MLTTSTNRRYLSAYDAWGFAPVRLRRRHRRRRCRCCRRRRHCCCSVRRHCCFFFASLHGGFEELVGVSSYRRVVAGGGVDFFGGVGSLPREAVVFAALQFLLEQELEVFLSFGFGLVFLGSNPEVELLCIPMQRSQRLVGCCWVPFGSRLSTFGGGVDGRGGKE